MKIALTGGIGSGKSAALKILNELGEKTISFDDVYTTLLKNDEFVFGAYKAVGLSPEYENEKLIFNKGAVSKKVFSDKNTLRKLNAYTHEKIFAAAFKDGEPFEKNGGRVFYEVPLLFEGGYQNRFDKVWVIVRDKTARVSSVVARDGLNESEIKSRIKNQFDYESCDLSIHTIILNDGDLSLLKQRVESALNELK